MIKVIEIYDDFNFSDIHNPSPVSLQGVTYNEDVFEPGNKELGLPIGHSWIWMLFCAFSRELPQPKEIYNGFGRQQSRGHCLYDRGKTYPLLPNYGNIGLWKILS